jgi:hypothetical protein
MKCTIWSEDFPEEGETTIDAERGNIAAKEWLEERWWRIGHPDEVRLFVRCDASEELRAYDVHVDGVMLDLTAMRVALDANGRPLTAEELQRLADEAMEKFRAKKAAENAMGSP